jgi:hypothetical protein
MPSRSGPAGCGAPFPRPAVSNGDRRHVQPTLSCLITFWWRLAQALDSRCCQCVPANTSRWSLHPFGRARTDAARCGPPPGSAGRVGVRSSAVKRCCSGAASVRPRSSAASIALRSRPVRVVAPVADSSTVSFVLPWRPGVECEEQFQSDTTTPGGVLKKPLDDRDTLHTGRQVKDATRSQKPADAPPLLVQLKIGSQRE